MTRLNFNIYRGLRFNGFRGICLDATGAPVEFGFGTTGQLEARRSPNKPAAFSLEVSLGESDGELIIDAIDSQDTRELPLGVYQSFLILTDAAGQATGPHGEVIITVHPAPLDS